MSTECKEEPSVNGPHEPRAQSMAGVSSTSTTKEETGERTVIQHDKKKMHERMSAEHANYFWSDLQEMNTNFLFACIAKARGPASAGPGV